MVGYNCVITLELPKLSRKLSLKEPWGELESKKCLQK